MARVLALLFCRPRGKLAYLVRVAHSRLPTALGLGVSTQGAVGGGDGLKIYLKFARGQMNHIRILLPACLRQLVK